MKTLRSMYVVITVTLLHAAWIPLIWLWPSATQVTSTHTLVAATHGREPAIALLVFVVLAAIVGLYRNERDVWTAFWFIPQLFVLTMSALGALFAIIDGHFADGVIRPRAFIAADQIVYIFLAAMYITEIFDRFGVKLWKRAECE